MACEIFLDFAGATGEAGLIVEGRIDGECRKLTVSIALSPSNTLQTEIDVGGTGERDWAATIDGVEPTVIASACKQGRVNVVAQCVEGGDCNASADLTFVCCPEIVLKKLEFDDDCIQAPQGGFAAVELELEVQWPDNYADGLQVSIAFRPADPPHVPTTTAVLNCTPDQSVYTQADFVSAPDGPLYIEAGFDYEVTVRVLQPERCAREIPFQRYSVPACDCDPLPAFESLIEIFDADDTPVPDIHSVECLESASIRIAPTQMPTGWAVAGDPDGETIAVSADDTEAVVTLPEDGSVTIALVTFGTGSCAKTVPISARRCVVPAPGDEGEPPADRPDDRAPPVDEPDEGEITNGNGGGLPDFCSIFAALLLIGVAVAAVGLVLLVCPAVTAPVIPIQYAMIVGGALLAVGVALVLFMLFLMWLFGCPLGACTWWKLGWQASFIVGAVAIYAGFCPACSWLLGGAALWLLAVWLFYEWRRRCRPSVCLQFAELLLATIAFDIAAALEGALGFCVITSNGVWAIVWAIFVVAFNVIVYEGLRRNNCLRS